MFCFIIKNNCIMFRKKDSNYDFPRTVAYTLKLTVQYLILSTEFRSFIFSLQLQIIKVSIFFEIFIIIIHIILKLTFVL